MGLNFKITEVTSSHRFTYREGINRVLDRVFNRAALGMAYMVFAVGAIGGFVVVGQMLSSYGSCQSV